jgi:ComF family protein
MVKSLLNMVLPPRCPLCNRDGTGETVSPFCGSCAEKIIEMKGPCCPTCGRPLPSQELLEENPEFKCGICRIHPLYLDSTHLLAHFSGPIRESIHLFKYSEHCRLGRDLIRRFRSRIKELLPKVDILIPIPLHPLRLRMRGFNQSVILGREVSRMEGIPIALDLIIRTRKGSPQVGLRGKERLRNVRGSFAVRKPEKIKDKKVLLVDDVMTTGATANECARVLKKANAGSVHLLALAGAVQAPNRYCPLDPIGPAGE